MSKSEKVASEQSVGPLLEGIVADLEKLVGQQLDLLRQEVRQEIGRAKTAAEEGAAGVGLLALGGIFTGHTLALLLHRTTGIPLWACYGVVALVTASTGAALLRQAGSDAARVRLDSLPQTTTALRENLTWLKEQVSPNRG
jgi:hypothetical protein